MGERDLSGSEHVVQERNVAKESNQSGLEEQTEVRVLVHHTLLRDRQVSGLANEQVRPLNANNGDKVTSLSISESLGGVANGGAGDVGVSVEGESLVGRGPSASRPGVTVSFSVEKSEVDSVVSGTIPVKSTLVLVILPVGVTLGLKVGLVGVVGVGQVTIFKGKVEGSSGAETVIVQDVEVGEETGGGLDNTNLEVSE